MVRVLPPTATLEARVIEILKAHPKQDFSAAELAQLLIAHFSEWCQAKEASSKAGGALAAQLAREISSKRPGWLEKHASMVCTDSSPRRLGWSSPFSLVSKEVNIPYAENLFKGRLFSVTSTNQVSSNKVDMRVGDLSSPADTLEMLRMATEQLKGQLVISTTAWESLLEDSSKEDHRGGIGLRERFSTAVVCSDLTMALGIPWSPLSSVKTIMEKLQEGQDIQVLQTGEVASGLIPAILCMMVNPQIHIEKIIWPLEHGDHEFRFSDVEKAYLTGLSDRAIESLSA